MTMTTSPFLRHFATAVTLASGLLFGFGLAYATMIRPESVLAFLTLKDFGLMLVLGSAMGINVLVFQLAPRLMKKPPLGEAFEQRPFALDRQAALGGALFGLGWGFAASVPVLRWRGSVPAMANCCCRWREYSSAPGCTAG